MLCWATVEEYPEMALAAPRDHQLFPVDAVGALTGALGELLGRVPAELEGAVSPFARALRAIQPAAAVAPPSQNLTVCRHLPAALAAARGTALEPAADAVRILAAEACWRQNPNYQRRPPDPAFLDNYGYFVVAGPADGPPAFVETPGLALGFLLLGPGMLYPVHCHPAIELYVALGDDGEWQRGDEPWRRQPAGTVIHHAAEMPHATRAGTTPLLAAYLWLGELSTHARLGQS